jgi:hypothetical protein
MPVPCEDCQQVMDVGAGCIFTHVQVSEDGEIFKRVALGEEPDDWGDPCHDCNVTSGQYHHAGCDVERCPKCGNQMLGCLGENDPEYPELAGCGWTVLRKEQ